MASQFTLLGTHIQGVLNSIIDAVNGKAPSSHNHDDRYYTETETNNLLNTKVAVAGSTMTGNINWAQTDRGLTWAFNTDGAYIKFFNTGDGDTNSRLEFGTSDNGNEFFRWTIAGVEEATLKADGLRVTNSIWSAGNLVATQAWVAAQGYATSSSTDYVSDVKLSESTLVFNGQGSAFSGNVDLSSLPFQPAGSYAAASHTHTFASLTSKPTTLSGYGITDAASSSHNHDSRYLAARGSLGTSTDVGSTAGWANNLAGGTYDRSYVGHSGKVFVTHDGGGSVGQFAIESTYFGDTFIHANVDSSSWATKQIWTSNNFTSTNISNWDKAYSWGNHADAGYLKSVTNISGNAATATKLATARSIALGGDVSGSANFDGSANITITATVADDSHNHIISNIDGLQAALDGKQAAGSYASASHTHVISDITSLQDELDGKQPKGSYLTSLPSHTHDYVPLSGGTMSGALVLKAISGTDQLVENTYGAYLHLGAWGVGRTAATAVLVNTAYRADYATDLWDMNISRFTNNSGYITGSYLGDYTNGSYRVIADYGSSTTWYMRGNGQFIWANAHDWTQSFRLSLNHNSTDNGTWAFFGQQDSNTTNGRYRGVRIRKYAGGAVDGDLSAGAIYIGDTQMDTKWTSAYDWGNHADAGYLKSVTNISGNAATATKLQTARTLTIGSTGKTFNGSANVSWTLAEIGAQAAGSYAAASHSHAISDVTGLQGELDGKQAKGSYAAASHSHAISDVTGLQSALDGKQAAGSYAASNHNHTYNVNDQWLRENGDNAHFKIYANTRQLVFRTDGTAEYNTGVGGYPFVWMYGGDAASNRRMLMDTSGNLWTAAYGWLHDYFQRAGSYAAASHSHAISDVTGLQGALDGKQAAGSYAAASHGHTGLSSNSWGGITSSTSSGSIDFGPANTSWAHIYTDRPAFYFNKDLYVNNAKMATESYVTSRGYVTSSGSVSSATSSDQSNYLNITGYGNGNMSYYQTSGTFAGYSGWAGYFISNHGDGRTYYNQTIITPFWGPPMYSRLEGGTFRGPYTFWTTENLDMGNYYTKDYVDSSFQPRGSYASVNGSYGTDFYANALYYDDWVRNHSNSNGMYWSTTGWHLYPINGAYFRIRSGNTATSGLRFMTGSTDRNYLHCNSSNEIGFLNTSGSWALRVDNSGNTTATGDVTAFSDVRLKENIKPISGALDKVLSLQGVYYNRIDIEDKSTKIGFIAQDVKHIIPEVVQISSDELAGIEDRHSVDYGKLVALLTEAIKEQQKQIDELKTIINGSTK